jgi:hypothetical protein
MVLLSLNVPIVKASSQELILIAITLQGLSWCLIVSGFASMCEAKALVALKVAAQRSVDLSSLGPFAKLLAPSEASQRVGVLLNGFIFIVVGTVLNMFACQSGGLYSQTALPYFGLVMNVVVCVRVVAELFRPAETQSPSRLSMVLFARYALKRNAVRRVLGGGLVIWLAVRSWH